MIVGNTHTEVRQEGKGNEYKVPVRSRSSAMLGSSGVGWPSDPGYRSRCLSQANQMHWSPNVGVSAECILTVIPTRGEEIGFFIYQLTIWLVRNDAVSRSPTWRCSFSFGLFSPECWVGPPVSITGAGTRGPLTAPPPLLLFLALLPLLFTLTAWACTSQAKHQCSNPCLRLCFLEELVCFGWNLGDLSSSLSSLAHLPCHFG